MSEKVFKVGKRYVVKEGIDDGYYRTGDILKFIEDDGTSNPWFLNETRPDEYVGGKIAAPLEFLSPYEKKFDTLEYGDLITSKYGTTFIVQGRIGDVIFAIPKDDLYKYTTYTRDEFYRDGVVIEELTDTEDGFTELTLEDIAEKFNIPVDQVRIKD